MIAEEIAARIRTLPDPREPADDRGHSIPLQDPERKSRDGKGGRNVAERDRQEKDDREEQAGRADDPLRDRMEQHAHPGPQETLRPVQDGAELRRQEGEEVT